MILVFLQPLNTTHRFIMFNAQHDEDHNNARSTSWMWMTMAIHGYSHNGSKTDLTMFCYKGLAQPKAGKSGGSVAALAPLRMCVGSCTPVYLIVVGDFGYCGL